MSDVLDRLEPARRLTGLSEADLAGILSQGRIREVRPGETILAEGDPCAGLFVLLQGQVMLKKVGPEGQEQTMGIIRPVAPFNGQTRPFSRGRPGDLPVGGRKQAGAARPARHSWP